MLSGEGEEEAYYFQAERNIIQKFSQGKLPQMMQTFKNFSTINK